MTTTQLAAAPTFFKLNDRATRADPYPTYAWLRETAPMAQTSAPLMGRMWVVSRHADVAAVLKDARFSSDLRRSGGKEPVSAAWMPRFLRLLKDSMVLTDDPDHARLRGLVHLAFTQRRVEAIAGRVDQTVQSLLDRMAHKGAGGPVDLIADFALPLPLTVISDMMGVPEAERHSFHHRMAGLLDAPANGPLQSLAQIPNGFHLMRFFEGLIRLRRAEPGDDLVSALVAAEQAGQRLSEDELLSMIFLLLLAGHETTVNLIGNGTLALLENPEQHALLRAQPGLIDRAVEELLRYGNPVVHGSPRIVLEDVELLGVHLPRGSKVVALLASANRDEAVFERADQLDITRHPNRHLAFGLGSHYCVGAPLARLEGQAAINALVQRFPALRLAVPAGRLVWRNTLGVRGLKALPVLVHPAGERA